MIKVAVAGGVTLVTSVLVLRSGFPPLPVETEPGAGAAEPAATPSPQPPAPATRTAATPHRPRILTGEPGVPEQRKPAPRRALKLVAGIAALAVAGAVGLLAFVRALISMFDQIGG